MTVQDIIELIEKEIPTDKALDWDNVGLLAGDRKSPVRRIYLALDATDEVIDHAAAWQADLLLTHHPLIFSGIKSVTEDTFPGRRIRKMVLNGISCYAMHTNFDVCVMADLAAEYLGLTKTRVLEICGVENPQNGKPPKPYGIGCVGELECPMTLEELAQKCADDFDLSHVKVFGEKEKNIQRVALCPGAGRSDMERAIASGADVYITGDIDHHSGIDAVAENMAVIDAGHYGVEHIYMDYMKTFLEERMADACEKILIAAEPKKEPFWICGKTSMKGRKK